MRRRKLYSLWITAFVLKSIGGSFDISYHFKYLREFYQLPHIINGLGNLLILGLFIFMWRTEPKEEREDLKAILIGIIVFCFGVVFDQWYHAQFGLDLTIWSPSHITLYVGTNIAILGMILQTLRDRRRKLFSSKLAKVYLLAFSFFLLDSFWYPLLQQEIGVIASYLFAKGTPLISKELLLFAHDPQRIILGGIPSWVYAAWASFSAAFVFTFAKQFQLGRFSSTAISGVYLLFRIITNAVYSAIAFPTSIMPYHLLLTAIVFDLSYFYFDNHNFNLFRRAAALGSLIALSIYSISLINVSPPVHPAMPPDSFWYSLVAAFSGFILAVPFRKVLPFVEEIL